MIQSHRVLHKSFRKETFGGHSFQKKKDAIQRHFVSNKYSRWNRNPHFLTLHAPFSKLVKCSSIRKLGNRFSVPVENILPEDLAARHLQGYCLNYSIWSSFKHKPNVKPLTRHTLLAATSSLDPDSQTEWLKRGLYLKIWSVILLFILMESCRKKEVMTDLWFPFYNFFYKCNLVFPVSR